MITLAPGLAIYFATAPTDMRKGFDGLVHVVAEHVRKNALDGGLYVFFNRNRNRVKLLWWQEGGLCIWYQRLERGTFELPQVDEDDREKTLQNRAQQNGEFTRTQLLN